MKKSGALDTAEDRGNFARGRAQAFTLCAQDRIQRSIVCVRREDFLDQLTGLSEPRMMRVRGEKSSGARDGRGWLAWPKASDRIRAGPDLGNWRICSVGSWEFLGPLGVQPITRFPAL